MTAFVARDGNGALIAWNRDLGNIMEETMIYQEMTGIRVTINEETFSEKPKS
jgi:hypothetical protein